LKKHLTLCATLLVLGTGGVATANAQSYYYYGAPRPPAYVGPRMYAPGLPPHEILAIVRASGLVPLSPAVRRGPRAYVLTAAGRGGEPVRVIVDAYAGDIRRVSPVVAMRPYGAPPVAEYPYDPRTRGALVEREFAPVQRDLRPPSPGAYPRGNSGATLTPPRSVPNPRVANAPATIQTPTAKPQHAPLPRPRPDVAAAPSAPTPTVPPPAAAPVQPQVAPAEVKTETAPKKPEAPVMAPVTPLD
jgi:hypothetical protein